MAKKLIHSIGERSNETGLVTKMIIFGVNAGGEACGEIALEPMGRGLVARVEMGSKLPAFIQFDKEGVRALRDACIVFLDQEVDGSPLAALIPGLLE